MRQSVQNILVVIFFSCVCLFSLVPQTFAVITPTSLPVGDCIPSELGCIPTDVGEFVKEFYGYGLSFIGGLALLFIIWGGYQIMTSRGNPVQLNDGKTTIMYALIGLFLAIFGYVFTELITRDILRIPGFDS